MADNLRDNEKWDITIASGRGYFDFNIKELWRYRDLLLMFVKKDIITVYKQTILGPIWFVVQPILTTIIFVFVFGNIAKIGTDGVPPVLFYLGSITIWNYFSETLNITSKTFTDNASIFGKVYFPHGKNRYSAHHRPPHIYSHGALPASLLWHTAQDWYPGTHQ